MNRMYMLSDAQSRSISAENPTGEKGAGGKSTDGESLFSSLHGGLEKGWKISPRTKVSPNQTVELACENT